MHLRNYTAKLKKTSFCVKKNQMAPRVPPNTSIGLTRKPQQK